MVGGPKDEKVDVDFVVWLIRGGGRNILFDSGFHRERWFKQWTITDYLQPDEAVRQAGVKPEVMPRMIEYWTSVPPDLGAQAATQLTGS